VGQPGKALESPQGQEQGRGTRSAGTRQAQICPHPAKLEQPKVNECAPTPGEMYHGNFSQHPNSLRGQAGRRPLSGFRSTFSFYQQPRQEDRWSAVGWKEAPWQEPSSPCRPTAPAPSLLGLGLPASDPV